jgi:hypothetical protein
MILHWYGTLSKQNYCLLTWITFVIDIAGMLLDQSINASDVGDCAIKYVKICEDLYFKT